MSATLSAPPRSHRLVGSSFAIPAAPIVRVLMSPAPFSATLARDEAVLRFPYDEGLRQLLRAIPGRRWDPAERAWCIPLGPDQAEALAQLFAALPRAPEVSDELERTIARRRARRRRDECLVDLARPDEDWWLSFATDGRAEPVRAPAGAPRRPRAACDRARARAARRALGGAARRAARPHGGRLRLSEEARRALRARSRARRARPRAARRRAQRRAAARPTTSSSAATAAASTGS